MQNWNTSKDSCYFPSRNIAGLFHWLEKITTYLAVSVWGTFVGTFRVWSWLAVTTLPTSHCSRLMERWCALFVLISVQWISSSHDLISELSPGWLNTRFIWPAWNVLILSEDVVLCSRELIHLLSIVAWLPWKNYKNGLKSNSKSYKSWKK